MLRTVTRLDAATLWTGERRVSSNMDACPVAPREQSGIRRLDHWAY